MSVDINMLLISVRQFMLSNINGYEICLNRCQTPAQKNQFIKHCQKLITQGWSADFQASLTDNDNNDDFEIHPEDFFLQIMRPILDNPKIIFQNNRTFNANDDALVRLMGRHALLKSVFNTCLNEPDFLNEENRAWIGAARTKLHTELDTMIKSTQVLFRGKILRSAEDFRAEFRPLMQNTANHAMIWAPLTLLTILIHTFLYKPTRHMLDEDTRSLCSKAFTFLFIGLMFKTIHAIGEVRAMRYLDATQSSADSIQANELIQKTFMISDSEFATLIPKQPEQPEQRIENPADSDTGIRQRQNLTP